MPKNKAQKREFVEVPQTNRGTYSELIACAYLIKQGYDVFTNISPYGQYDIVVFDKINNKFFGLDVKTGNFSINIKGEKSLHYPKSKYPNTKLLIVTPDGECVWEKP